MKKLKQIFVILIFSLIIGGTAVFAFVSEDKDVSLWERRKLQQFPEISSATIKSGQFMREFEVYLADQFPFRDGLRRLKARVSFDLFGQKDSSGIYFTRGHFSKLEPRLNTELAETFTDKITNLYTTCLKGTDCRAYYSIIPDKNYFLAEENGYPSLDYEKLYSIVDEGLGYMTKITVTDLLSLDHYYTTDTHWKQERLLPVANRIRLAMGMAATDSYEEKSAGDFLGVYYGQSALEAEPDEIRYLTNEEIKSCTVFSQETKKESKVYNEDKLSSPDKYDFFLSGADAFLEITNPCAKEERELVIFRDSFSSSLAPLLISSYSKITLIDTRYILPHLVGEYITFDNQDVLFIYSTMLVNSSSALK